MAERIVVIGIGGDALEIANALDADVMVREKTLRVSVTRWGGSLANATVLFPHKKFLGVEWENASPERITQALDRIQRLSLQSRRIKIEERLVVHVPLGAAGVQAPFPRPYELAQ